MPSPPPLSRDAPVHLVMVHRQRPDGTWLHDLLGRHPKLAGRDLHWHVARPSKQLPALAAQAAAAARESGGIVIAAGGDGTINTVSHAAWAAGVPVGVVTSGTFNYFSRQHGLQEDPLDALGQVLDALDAGRLRPVPVGFVNDQLFLVNASVGAYTRLLAERERATRRFGRKRWVALAAAVFSLLRPDRGQRLLMIDRGGETPLDEPAPRVSTLFVGNNALQLERVGLPEARDVAAGALGAVMLRPQGLWASARMLWRAVRGRLAEEPDVRSFAFEHLEVRPAGWRLRRRIKVAFDGERAAMSLPLQFRVGPRPLWLVAVPVDAAVSAEDAETAATAADEAPADTTVRVTARAGAASAG